MVFTGVFYSVLFLTFFNELAIASGVLLLFAKVYVVDHLADDPQIELLIITKYRINLHILLFIHHICRKPVTKQYRFKRIMNFIHSLEG